MKLFFEVFACLIAMIIAGVILVTKFGDVGLMAWFASGFLMHISVRFGKLLELASRKP